MGIFKNLKITVWKEAVLFKPPKRERKRMMGVEPTSPAWKAGVIAVIRHPQRMNKVYPLLRNLSRAECKVFWRFIPFSIAPPASVYRTGDFPCILHTMHFFAFLPVKDRLIKKTINPLRILLKMLALSYIYAVYCYQGEIYVKKSI